MKTLVAQKPQRGTAAILAAIIIFGIIFTSVFGYYYFAGQAQQAYQNALKNQEDNIVQANSENLVVYGSLSQTSRLYININNTGPSISIVAYWILNETTGAVIQYENTTTTKHLPLLIGQGQSYVYTNTNITITSIFQIYLIRVLTSKGTTTTGSFPSAQLVASSINSLVAAGIGSLRMSFSSFNWYSYVSGPPSVDSDGDYNEVCTNNVQCNGGSWKIDISHPHVANLVPQGQNTTGGNCGYCGIMVPIAFSINITNYDPSFSTLVINSQANLWIIETCDTATFVNNCPQGNPVYVFYIMNVNPSTGAITSTNQGSFSPILIPYGTTKTLYFGAAYDLSRNSFASMSLSSDDSIYAGNNLAYYGEFAVFILFSGTKLPQNNVFVYGQNIPFQTTISADNLGWYSESPILCPSGSPTSFTLQMNNSVFSGYSVNQIILNASSLSSVSATAPTGWSKSVSAGVITWTNTKSNNLINPGGTLSFSWSGTAPNLGSHAELAFPITIQWNGGGFQVLQGASACYD